MNITNFIRTHTFLNNEEVIREYTKTFLTWVKEEGFVLYKDNTWYSPKHFKGKPSIYYTDEQLIELYETI